MTQMDITQRSTHQGEGFAVSRRWRRTGVVILGWAGFIGLWALVSQFVFGPYMLPGPLRVAIFMWEELISTGLFFSHFAISIGKVFAGFGVAVIIGIPVGYLMGTRRYWKSFFHDPVMLAGSIPGITYAIMALVIFGISLGGPILAVAVVSMVYVAINVAEGLEGVDRKLTEMSHAYRRRQRDIVRHVLIPSILPFAFAGIRLSFALAWKVEQLTEVFGSSSGVGLMIRKEYEDFSITGVLAWVLLFIGFMLLIERFGLVELERWLFRWRGTEKEVGG